MKSRRILSLLAVATLATTIFVGCGSKSEAKEAGLKDGTYTATNDKNTASIEIEVKDGKIATVKYDEVQPNGNSKLTDAEYNEKMKAASGTTPQEAYPALEKALIEKQDAASIDVITGATGSTERFKTLAEEALKSAK